MANEFKIRKGLIVTGASGGTVVDIQGSQGQLFSVTDNLSGSIFAVSDISGVPIFDVNSSSLSTFDGNVTFKKDVNITQTTDVGALNTTTLDNGSAVGLSLTYPTSNVVAGDGLAIAIGITGRGRSYIANSNTSNNLDASNLEFYTEGGGVINKVLTLDQNKDATFADNINVTNSASIGSTVAPARTLDVRGTGMSIFGTGDYTELMLRGQVEGTGTVRNVGSWHWSVRSDVGGDNDDLKLLRFVTGTFSGAVMQIQNSTGDIFFGNTVVNPASGYSTQKGFGYDTSTGNLEVASTSGTPMTVGRNETTAGEILELRKESNIIHSFGSTDSYLLSNVGIGTTLPGAKLDVAGAIKVGNSGTSRFTDTNAFPLQLNRGLDVDVYGANGAILGIGSLKGTTYTDAARFSGALSVNGTDGNMSLQTLGSGAYSTAITLNSVQAVRFNAYGAGTLVTDASGNITAATSGPGSGDITGSGAANYVTKFTGTKTIGNGPIYFNSNDIELLQPGVFNNSLAILYNGTASGGTGTTAVQYIKIFDKSGNGGQQYLHFELLSFNNSEYSAEVKITVPSYSGFSSSYGTMDEGQGVQVEIIYGGLSGQTSSILSIIECADLSNVNTNTDLYLKIQPAANNTQIKVKDYGDCTTRVLTNQTWSTTAPSNQTREFTFNVGATNINEVLSIHRDQKVGIGTNSPNAKLDVKNNDGNASGLHIVADFNQNAGAGAQMILGYYANGTSPVGPLVYAANGMPQLINASGGIQFSNDLNFSSSFLYTFRDAVGINNPNSVSATPNVGYTMCVGRSYDSGSSVSGSISAVGTIRASAFTTGINTTAGIGGSNGDVNAAETGPGYINLSRDDTASAQQIRFEKNGTLHSYIETTTSGLNIGNANVYLAKSANQGQLFFGTADNQYEIFGGGTWGYMGYNTSGYHRFFGSGTETMRITNTGNVGINSTNPGSKLVVAGGTDTAYNDGTLKVVGTIALNAANNLNPSLNRWVLRPRAAGVEGSFDIYDARHSLSRLTIVNSGNVGIGEASPTAKLEVYHSGGTAFNVTGSQGQLLSVTDDLSGSIFAVADISGVPIFNVNSSGVSYFDSKVGIGTNSPDEKLTVNGITRAVDPIYFGAINTDNGTYGPYIESYDDKGLKFDFKGNTGGEFQIWNHDQNGGGATEVFTIEQDNDIFMPSSNVTIGKTTAALGRLDVDGTFIVSVGTQVRFRVFYTSNYTFVNGGTNGSTIYFGAPTSNVQNIRVQGTATATNFILSSDEILKDNIKNIDNKHIDVDWKNFELKSEPGVKRAGVIAQELEKKHPEFVRTDEEGLKSVAYIDLLIAKIAELEARLEKAGL